MLVNIDVSTSLETERRAQRRWRLRPGYENVRDFDRLIELEFLSTDEQQMRQNRMLAQLVRFVTGNVSYYRKLFARLGLSAEDIQGIDDLYRLPVLTRNEVVDRKQEFIARRLPPGERIFGRFSSSGTTGRPVRVLMTERSNLMFTLANQRQYRWFRFEPDLSYASIASFADQMPRQKDGTPYPAGYTYHQPRWRYTGRYFKTGPQVSFAMNNPADDQLAWLKQHRPGYLTSNSQALEHLAFACEGDWPVDSLKAVISIATQMTPAMRRTIEQTMGVPVFENYGFNEIGVVALRCAAGHYHVMSEHCLIEVVDEEGRPCAPGQVGRLVVTTLTNLAMPLLRYDAGDLAKAVAGSCPCGRTLPAFGEIIGRYRRTDRKSVV